MANLLPIVALFLVLLPPLLAFFAALGAFFPGRVARTRQMITTLPGRSALVGAINAVFLGALGLVFFQLGSSRGVGVLTIFGGLLAAALLVGVSFGLTGVVEWLGERLAPSRSRLVQTACGGTLLSLGCAFPLVGWFGLLPFAIVLGLGAFIYTFFNREPPG